MTSSYAIVFCACTLVVLTSVGCSVDEADQKANARADFAVTYTDENLIQRSGKEEIADFFKGIREYRVEAGCVGNLGIEESDCSKGKTFVGTLAVPTQYGGGTAEIYVFTHDGLNVIAYEVVGASSSD